LEDPRHAVGFLARECYGRPDENIILVGITGTNGKTTVAYMVDSIAHAAGWKTGRIGTVGYAYEGVDRSSARTTPEAPELFAILAEMRDASTDLVAMEVSSHALAQGRVNGARFAVAAFLNLGRDHLDYHGDRESYFRTKALLFESLDPGRTAVLPADDPLGRRLAARTEARVMTFGRSKRAAVRITAERVTRNGSEAILATPYGEVEVRTPLIGAFNLENAAAATACALAADLPPEAASMGIKSLPGVPGRMEKVEQGQPFTVLIDYAHTEEALFSVLTAARSITGGKVLVVFGCGGERDRSKRSPMGATAARIADEIFLTSDNSRGEDPEAILDDIQEGVSTVRKAAVSSRRISDRSEAIDCAISAATEGDVVVIAGKGHETTQTIAGRVEEFDDRVLAGRILAAHGWAGETGAGT